MKVLKKLVLIEFSGPTGVAGLDLDKAKIVMKKEDILRCEVIVDHQQAKSVTQTRIHLTLKTNCECMAGYQRWDQQKQQLD